MAALLVGISGYQEQSDSDQKGARVDVVHASYIALRKTPTAGWSRLVYPGISITYRYRH